MILQNINNLNYSVFKKNNNYYVYTYNKNYYVMLVLHHNEKSKHLKNSKKHNYMLVCKKLILFLQQIAVYKNSKIKFTGKGYKIKKNTNTSLRLLFNRAHITTVIWKNVFLKKLKKYKIYIYGAGENAIQNVSNYVLHTRVVNIFTKKGLRSSKQIIYKKKK